VKPLTLAIAALLLISFFTTACGIPGDTTQTPGANTSILLPKTTIAVDATLPRFELPGANQNDPAGFDIDLMKNIAAGAGLNIQFVQLSYERIIDMVGQCQVDMAISAITLNDGLKNQVDVSNPYLTTSQELVAKKGNITITGLDSLTGMTVGALAGSPGQAEIQAIPGAQEKLYPNFFLAFQDLIAGYIDAVIADKFHAAQVVAVKTNNLKLVGKDFGSVNYGIVVCKNKPDLLKKINDGLAAADANGTLKKLARKWLNIPGQ
jgi:polar amino acid transport system substrate-binding protein